MPDGHRRGKPAEHVTTELYLAYNIAHEFMVAHGLRIQRSLVGTYATSLDMQGLSVTLAFLSDEEFSLWDSPVSTAALRWGW